VVLILIIFLNLLWHLKVVIVVCQFLLMLISFIIILFFLQVIFGDLLIMDVNWCCNSMEIFMAF